MSNYYRSSRTVSGRFGHKRMDWTKIANDALNACIAIWISGTIIDLILKAHGL